MKTFYIHNGSQQYGPFNPEQLRDQGITPETLVWQPGMADWARAGEIAELQQVFNPPASGNVTPPPLPFHSINKPKKKPSLLFAAIAIGIVLLSGSAFIVYKNGKDPEPGPVSKSVRITPINQDTVVSEPITRVIPAPKQTNETKAVHKEIRKEVYNPVQYLSKTIKTHRNVLGQHVIEGTISNVSSNLVFKDVVLDVSYLSKTGAVITTQRLVVYEIIKPGKKIPFKFKTKPPMGTKNSSAELVTAVAVR